MNRSKFVFTLCLTLLLCLTLFSCSTTLFGISRKSSRYVLINDMFLNHEGIPAGLPNYIGWKYKPTVGFGVKIPEGWNAIYAWGQVYADETEPNPNKDFPLVRVHIKDLQLYIYRKNGSWDLIQNEESPIGDAFREDFVDNWNILADIEQEEGGGISVQAGSGLNFHFYPRQKNRINGDDIKGVFVICKARLIGTENYDTLPKYLLNIGGDYWRNTRVSWAPDYENNNDIAIGRFKYVTPEWQYFIMHTFSQKEVKKIVFPIKEL